MLNELNIWIQDVANGVEPAGVDLVLACKRHLNDLEKSKSKEYPFTYSESEVIKYFTFIGNMKFVEGEVAGQFIQLAPFQQFIVASIFGWIEKDTGRRRFKDAYIQVAKKNAKTTLAAIILLCGFYVDNVNRGQFYFAATSRDQANIAYNCTNALVSKMVEMYEDCEEVTAMYSNSIQRVDNGSLIRSVSKEAGNLEGRGAYMALGDEYHVAKNDEVINNISSGMLIKYSNNTLFLRTTTAGSSIMGPCHRFYLNVAKKVITGVVEKERQFVFITELTEEDWKELERLYHLGYPKDKDGVPLDFYIWKKSNPNVGVNPELETLREKFHDAMLEGGRKEIDVKTKHGNMWVGSNATWISDTMFMKGAEPLFSEEDLVDGVTNLGLDLAKTDDLCCVFENITVGKDENEIHFVIPHFYIPEAKLKNETDGVDYALFVMEGFIKVAGENTIDDRIIEADILEIIEKRKVNVAKYDPACANRLILSLQEKTSVPFEKLGQSWTNVSPPTKFLKQIIISEKVRHNGNPVLRWMMSNINIKQNGDYIRINKRVSGGKVDGPAAWTFALSGFLFNKPVIKKAPEVIVL